MTTEPHINSGAQVLLGLGANLGDPRKTLSEACQQIIQTPDITHIQTASLYQSDPVDAPGPHYYNTAMLIRTELTPLELLGRMQAIENQFGRVRSVQNAPRTLDIDLLWHEQASCDEAPLTLPHPRLHLRAFVLKPLIELLGPSFAIQNQSAQDWLSQCQGQYCEPTST